MEKIMSTKTIGYFAVIMPEMDFWQGVYLITNPKLEDAARRLIRLSSQDSLIGGYDIIGTLQASLTDCVMRRDEERIPVIALALSNCSDTNYFVIKGNKLINGSMRTEMIDLFANSVEDAREQIMELPEVLRIARKIHAQTSMRDGAGRHRVFH